MDIQEQQPEHGATQAVSAPSTLRAHVVQMLTQAILTGRYKPGDRLNESQIARELNISRIPVREALSQLQEQGLVQNRERRGMFVIDISAEEVKQIISLRLLLETEAFRLAALRMTPELEARLENLIAQMEIAERAAEGSEGDLLDGAALDMEFHRTVWRASGNPYLDRTLYGLIVPLFAHKTLEHVSHEDRQWRTSHHRTLLDAITGRSQEDVGQVLQTHLRMSYTEAERHSALTRKAS